MLRIGIVLSFLVATVGLLAQAPRSFVISTAVGTGVPGYDGDGGPAAAAGVRIPGGIAVGRDGTLFVADTGNSRVRKVLRTGFITTVAGCGEAASLGDGDAATAAAVQPVSLVLDAAGDLYIVERGSRLSSGRVRKVSNEGFISTVVGTSESARGYPGDGGLATQARLVFPIGAVFDNLGNLYIAEAGDFEGTGRVRKVDRNGIIHTIAGGSDQDVVGEGGPALGVRLSPSAIAIDSSDNLYIADSHTHSIRMISPDGVITTLMAVATAPSGLAIDDSGGVYYSIPPRVYYKPPNGQPFPVAGDGVDGPTDGLILAIGDGGPALKAKLRTPGGLAMDAAGNLYVDDAWDARIRKLIPAVTGDGCTYDVTSRVVRSDGDGAAGSIEVRLSKNECGWTAVSYEPWLMVTPSGGIVSYVVQPNTDIVSREGHMAVAGSIITVTQAGGSKLPVILQGGVRNAAGMQATIAPGSFVSIFGRNLSAGTTTWSSAIGESGRLPVELAGTRVQVNGTACFLSYVSPKQVNALLPPGLSGAVGRIDIITSAGVASTQAAMDTYSPAFFSFSAGGRTLAAAVFAGDTAIVAPSGAVPEMLGRPAQPGDHIQLYLNGLGPTQPAYPVGYAFSRAYPTADPSLVSLTIAGLPSQVLFSGMTMAGVFQVNAAIPTGTPRGLQPVTVRIGGRATQPGILIAIAF